MRDAWYPLLFGLLSAVGNLVGGFLVAFRSKLDHLYLNTFMALGAGFMLAAAFLEMIPQSLKLSESAPLFWLLGYLLVHFFEHSIVPHFHYGEETHPDELGHHGAENTVLFGLLIHTFFDGVSIGSAFLVKPSLGVLVFVSVILHKIPEGFTIGSVMQSHGRSALTALASSLAIGVATLMGVVATLVWMKLAVGLCLATSAGVAIYVAASELIPIVNQERGVRWALVVFAGVAFFWMSEQLLHLAGIE
ncbi:MAG: ZIP family metal transporter [Candidatus Wallbacteria bacterium]|nr:ZIP family metal transporter [Candidatus Wallbacteria bacterium]